MPSPNVVCFSVQVKFDRRTSSVAGVASFSYFTLNFHGTCLVRNKYCQVVLTIHTQLLKNDQLDKHQVLRSFQNATDRHLNPPFMHRILKNVWQSAHRRT
jgi:hypothetical protein